MPPPSSLPALPRVGLAAGLTLVLTLGLLVAGPPNARADGACATNRPYAGDYRVTVCVSVPGTVLSGAPIVAANVTVDPPGSVKVSRATFWFRDSYLLSDHDAPFAMSWRTDRLDDGLGVLEARVRMSDGFFAKATTAVTLSNGTSRHPVNTATFTPSTGTTPEPGQPFRMAAVGDGVDGSPRQTAVADMISSWKPNLLAYLGDVYARGSPFEFDNWYGSAAGGYGRFRDITNPVVGNHEYRTAGAAGFFDYWDNIGHYYSYDVAGWHVVALDSSANFGQLQPGSAQYDWLAADLAANTAHCTIAYMHHPRYSVTKGGGRTRLRAVWALLAARRVTLALTGHVHSYERWEPLDAAGAPDPRGITQVIAGAGGHEVVEADRHDGRVVAHAAVSGVLRLDLFSEHADLAYVDVNGAVRDRGSAPCTSTGDTFPPTTPSSVTAKVTAPTELTMSWTASTDEKNSVAGYRVRRDGEVIATVGPDSTSYVDTALAPGERAGWTVEAFDPSDNVSAPSESVAAQLPPAAVTTVNSGTLLARLARAGERPRRYSSARFGGSADIDRDRCRTRAEVLLSEALARPLVREGCVFGAGRWFSRLDGVTRSLPTTLRVDRLVSPREAWRSGARGWTAGTRNRFANDLGYEPSLSAVTAAVHGAKGSSEPQRWLPPRRSARCDYLAEWVAVKWRWRLAVDKVERRFLARRLAACNWPAVTAPARATVVRR